MFRVLVLLVLLLAGGCVPPPQPTAVMAGAPVAEAPAGSWECSIVRWDRGQGFCRYVMLLPPPAFCSRALGGVDCWADPAALPNRPRALADNPPPLLLAPLPPVEVAVPVPEPLPAPVPVQGPVPVPGPILLMPPPSPVPQPPPVQTGGKTSHAQDYEAL